MHILISAAIMLLMLHPSICSPATKGHQQTRMMHHPSDAEFVSSTGPPSDEMEGSGESPEFSSMPVSKSHELVFRTSTTTRPSYANSVAQGNSSATSTKKGGEKKSGDKNRVKTTPVPHAQQSMPTAAAPLHVAIKATTSTVPTPAYVPSTKMPITVRITKGPDVTTSTSTTTTTAATTTEAVAVAIPESAPEPEESTTVFTLPPVIHMASDHATIPTIEMTPLESTQGSKQESLPSPASSSMAVLCYDVYQHCLLSQTSRFGVDPIGPYFVDELLLPQFCKQHEEIVQPCMAKTLQLEHWDRALDHCASATQQDEQASSTTAYMIIRAARTWQFMCQLHKLHLRNDTVCFREKMAHCVLNMDLNFMVKCQGPCENVLQEEVAHRSHVGQPNSHSGHHDIFSQSNNTELDINLENEELQLSRPGHAIMPWSEFVKKQNGHGRATLTAMDAQMRRPEVVDESGTIGDGDLSQWLISAGALGQQTSAVGIGMLMLVWFLMFPYLV